MFKKRRIKRRRRKYKKREKAIPFVKIFKLYKEGYSIINIARELKMKRSVVHSVINGGITIPKNKIEKVRNLGLKICSCCHRRVVPIEPIDYVILTRLCKRCYKNETTDEDGEYCVNIIMNRQE